MARTRLAFATCALASGSLASCSLIYGLHDNLGPLDDAGEEAIATDDVVAQDHALAPRDGDPEASADASVDVSMSDSGGAEDSFMEPPPATDWCAVDAGKHTYCDDFDVQPLDMAITKCTGGLVALDKGWSSSAPYALETSAPVGCNQAEASHAISSTAKHAHLEFDMRVDSVDNNQEDHVFGLSFVGTGGGATSYTVFFGMWGASTYLEEYANVGPGQNPVNGPPVAAGLPQHVWLDVNLQSQTATVSVAGKTATRTLAVAFAPQQTVVALGLDYRAQPASGTAVTVRADNVTLDLQ
jgi:hypothetical protein